MKFTSSEEFELHVHKCFGKIFDGLLKVDAVVKDGAEKEEDAGKYGVMCDLRDTVEEVILHCHLAWQVPSPVQGCGRQKRKHLGKGREFRNPRS